MLFAPAWADGNKKNKKSVPPYAAENFVDEDGNPFPIDNTFWPLVPGTTFVYEATDESERNEVYVSHDIEEVAGVDCVVVKDSAWEDDLLVEYTIDWYAQDKDGNVWYFGEYSEAYEYDDYGNLIATTTEGSWEAGVDGAEPGIVMLANPQPGKSYRQEFYEGIAEDMAKVLRLNASVSVAYGDFEDCLKTKEWTPLEPGVIEHKYYARGVGLVLVEELKGKKRVELIDIITQSE
jgi:hypothetical protein